MSEITKKFIMVMPLQPEGKLNKCIYNSNENTKLIYNHETRFPIIPVIANNVSSGDKIKIVVILTDYENARNNYKYLKEEVEDLSKTMGFYYEFQDVNTEYDESIHIQLKLFSDIISKVRDNEELYACITYGTKTTPIILTMALNYAYKIKKNVSVETVVYGRYDFNTNKSYIHDTTSLFYMDSIVSKMAELKVSDPEGAIRTMLNIE